jgi:Aldehyde dehydrogenase family
MTNGYPPQVGRLPKPFDDNEPPAARVCRISRQGLWPFWDSFEVGPLHSESALHRATEQLSDASKRGALVKLGGRHYQPWGLRGYFLQPTVLVEGSGLERSLCAASFEPRMNAYTPMVDRAWKAARTEAIIEVESIEQSQPDWFPYKNRRGMKL